MGCCPTHDGIKLAAEALREALRLPSLADETRHWLERKLLEMVEREAVLVEGPNGTWHSGIHG
jgi:hypothetical protein